MAYKSGNPALNKNTFDNLNPAIAGEAMTLDGVAGKSIIMLLACVACATAGWQMAARNDQMLGVYLISSLVGAFVIGVITIFKRSWSPVTAPLYAILEGFALGAISRYYEVAFGGIVLQAVMLTTAIFLSLLLAYRSHLIRATENFKLGVTAATGGIALYYVANLVIGFFGKQLPLIASTSLFGIGFTVLVIVVAALNLVIDFDFIEQGVDKKAPKYMEWYASFGLFVTLVWLYLEILRLLSKIRSR